MPDARRVKCRECKARVEEVGAISWRGLCGACAQRIVNENVDGLAGLKLTAPPECRDDRLRGVRERWRRGIILSAGGLLPEQLQPRS